MSPSGSLHVTGHTSSCPPHLASSVYTYSVDQNRQHTLETTITTQLLTQKIYSLLCKSHFNLSVINDSSSTRSWLAGVGNLMIVVNYIYGYYKATHIGLVGRVVIDLKQLSSEVNNFLLIQLKYKPSKMALIVQHLHHFYRRSCLFTVLIQCIL